MNQSEETPLLQALVQARRSGRPCALATVVETRGSTPRKAGTKMLVDPEVGLVGTVGGGCGEAEVLEAAARVLAGAPAEIVRVDLTKDLLSWSPAVCGGIMEVLVEAVPGRAEADLGGDPTPASNSARAPVEESSQP